MVLTSRQPPDTCKSLARVQTIIFVPVSRASEGALGACGGVGSLQAAWIQAHDANVEFALEVRLLITPTSSRRSSRLNVRKVVTDSTLLCTEATRAD
jgi:hypothetical protein